MVLMYHEVFSQGLCFTVNTALKASMHMCLCELMTLFPRDRFPGVSLLGRKSHEFLILINIIPEAIHFSLFSSTYFPYSSSYN